MANDDKAPAGIESKPGRHTQKPTAWLWATTVATVTMTILASGLFVRGSHPRASIPSEPVASISPDTHSSRHLPDAQEDMRDGLVITYTGRWESPIRFEPNSKSFVDPAAAAKALTPIARWLAKDRSRHAWVEGTTADIGPMSGQIKLSRLRAEHVRAELIALGDAPAQITATGVGSKFPQFIRDRNSSGTLLTGPAALNRSVRITLRRAS